MRAATTIGEDFVHDLLQDPSTSALVDSVLFTGLTGDALADVIVGPVASPEPDGGGMPSQSQSTALESQTLTAFFNTEVPSWFVTPLDFDWVLNGQPVLDVLPNGSTVMRVPPVNAVLTALGDAGTDVLDVISLGAAALQVTGGDETPGMSGSLNGVPLTVQDLIDVLRIINESHWDGDPTGAVIVP